jgi:hypothetical protein
MQRAVVRTSKGGKGRRGRWGEEPKQWGGGTGMMAERDTAIKQRTTARTVTVSRTTTRTKTRTRTTTKITIN